MKTILQAVRIILLAAAACLVSGAQAQPQITPTQAAAMRPLDPATVPSDGTFWLLDGRVPGGASPPFPSLPPELTGLGLPVYDLGGGNMLIDDSSVDYAALDAQSRMSLGLRSAQNSLSVPSPGDGDSGDGGDDDTNALPFIRAYTFDTNGLWLEITNVFNGLACLNLHHATNPVYAIWSTTNLLAGWQVEAEVWPSSPDVMPFTVPTLGRQSLFMRAEDWTGVDSDGDGIPDWWIWLYFGNLSQSATNLDSQGNSLLYDYTNGLDPNIITFTLSATNRYVNQTTAPLQVGVLAGTPSYYAVLVNDTNPADASWLAYPGPNLTANLGATDGVYAVSVGLRGLPPSAQQTWQTVQLARDTVAPMVVITNPIVSVTAQPTIQLQGYSTKPLSAVSYDLSNALGTVSNQAGFVRSQFFDPALFAFTTNWIQCYDLDLTNGVNTITLRATDWAGNTATTNFNLTLDYSTAANPVIQVVWPQDGSQICAGVFTCRGVLDDPTATVTAQITDTNGNVNAVTGLVERNGNFWLEDLPLSGGANLLTIAVTNAAGLATVTNLTLGQGALALRMNPVAQAQLWQPTLNVTGTVSDASCPVWVNGAAGVNNGDGTWYALNVTSSPGGVACFDLTAQSAAGASVNNTNIDKPAEIVVTRYENAWTSSYTPNGGTGSGPQPMAAMPAHSETYHLLWREDAGTTAYDAVTESGLICTTNYVWPADEDILELRYPTLKGTVTPTCSAEVDLAGPPVIPLEHCNVATNLSGQSGTDAFTRTAQTSLTLLTGGKGQSHEQRLFQIRGSAFAITNIITQEGYSVYPTQVLMGALGPLGTDGRLWCSLQANDTKDITDNVRATLPLDDYTFVAAQIEYAPSITADGVALSNSVAADGARFCVGKDVPFALVGLPDGVVATNFQWALDGKYVNRFIEPQRSNTFGVYTNDPSLLTNAVITNCWWVSGGYNPPVTYHAGLTCILTFTNGNSPKSFVADGRFTMFKPNLYRYGRLVPRVILTNNILGAYFAGGFAAYIHSDFNGLAGVTQLLNGYATNATPDRCANTTNNWDVDTWQFYRTRDKNPEGLLPVVANSGGGVGANNYVGLSDRPRILCNGDTALHWDFKDYIRFHPDGENSVYVTLGIVHWHAYGSAGLSNGSYVLTSASEGDTDEAIDPSSEFPSCADLLIAY